MDNSAYVPNPLPPPSLVVFSQAGGLPDALRMQRPFTSQAQEGKDPVGVSLGGGGAGGFGLRLMDSYPGLPAHLLHLPQFLHPGGVPFPASFPSAFAPPPRPPLKSLTMDDVLATAGAMSPPAHLKEEDDSREPTPGSETTERSTPDEGRGFRHDGIREGSGGMKYWACPRLPKSPLDLTIRFHSQCDAIGQINVQRKKKPTDTSCCPVCGVTVRPADLDSHFVQELERLYKLTVSGRTRRLSRDIPASADGSLESRWETYQRIKANRQSRLRLKNRKRKPDDVVCPVCNEGVNGTVEQLNNHVELCLRKHGSGGQDDDETVDVEGEGEMYEEYEWAGQRRIRASSLLLGGYAGAGIGECRSSEVDDEEGDGEVVVDGDDSATFGPTQYSEADVIVPSADGPNQERERQALRDAVISPDGTRQIKEEPSPTERKDGEVIEQNGSEKVNPSIQVIDALKCKIRQLEADQKAAADHKFICLICMEHYKKPLISICCWHVHCEQCWLHTLGAKKLCPQCNMITSPSDLRRIYL